MSAGSGPEIDSIRRVVLLEDLHEVEIRPPEQFLEWLRLLEKDVARQFPDPTGLIRVPCPGCGRDEPVPAFARLGFQYVRCGWCRSVYVSPRPRDEALRAFATTSNAMAFWFRQFLKKTEPGRRERIFRPRASWIADLATQDPTPRRVFVDVHAKYGAFLEEVASFGLFDRHCVLAPRDDLRDRCRELGFEELQDSELAGVSAMAVAAMEVIERVYDPGALLATIWTMLADGGMVFLTTTSGTGFSVQALGAASPHALPPVHLNLLSVEGITQLLHRAGFEIIELSTPGQLDTEMVVNAARLDPALVLPPVISEIVRHRGPDIHLAFQQFLQEARLSSHVRAAARKPRAGQVR